MSTRKTTLFYALLIAVSSVAVGMVIASRLDLTPSSAAQGSYTAPAMNSAPITGPLDAQTFRNIAKAQQPMVVNIRTESKGKGQDLSDLFGGGGGGGDDFLHRFFGGQGGQAPGGAGGDDDQTPGRRSPPGWTNRLDRRSPCESSRHCFAAECRGTPDRRKSPSGGGPSACR